jgi:D-glycero-alpha-D-manno-heptose-7-phosphate kinase
MHTTLAVSRSLAGTKLVLTVEASVADAIRTIENGGLQTAFIVDANQILLGLVTNGDVRRFLIAGGVISSPVEQALNRNFRAVRVGEAREESLKLFDMGYSVVPRLDEQGRLIDLLTPESHHDYKKGGDVVVRARAPARISFAGGGTDLTYYFSRMKGLVLNAAIARYATTTLIPRATSEIDIYSGDLGTHQHFSSLRSMFEAQEHSLLSATALLVRPDFGFEMHVCSEFPVGSGLGGSSAVTASVLSAFNELRIDRWSAYEIAELAFQAERLCFKVPGGWQDQYAAAFGGFNLIEFMPSGNSVNALRLPDDVIFELEESLILFDTGLAHNSGDQHKIQKAEMSSSRGDAMLAQMMEFCLEMNKALARRDLRRFGEGLHEAWLLKKQTSSRVSTGVIDEIYDMALAAGALGGKLLGAGGGGHILFFAPPGRRARVIEALVKMGCKPAAVRFDLRGAHSWKARMQ